METQDLSSLRNEIESINYQLLELLCRRGELVTLIHKLKTHKSIPTFIPEREQEMLVRLAARNRGPFSDDTIKHLFKEIFGASVQLMEASSNRKLRVSRARRAEDLHIKVRGQVVGLDPVLVAGPCAVESEAQMEEVAGFLVQQGVRFIRGGAFKPRSSPYSFQGLGEEGLKILSAVGVKYDLVTVTEVMDPRMVELVGSYADILQIGSRSMYNYDLLREVGRCKKPVLLKRGLSATIDELLWSAEYIVCEGNERVILCERGIRTFERQTRNTLDISAIPLLRQKSYLPVIVDVSHATGRRDILAPLGRAALAAGANGLMVEAHPNPEVARSDSQQQLDLDGLRQFIEDSGFGPQLRAKQPSKKEGERKRHLIQA